MPLVPLTFAEWMEDVNEQLLVRCGLTSDDLPDWGYRDAYDAGIAPAVAARRALKACGF